MEIQTDPDEVLPMSLMKMSPRMDFSTLTAIDNGKWEKACDWGWRLTSHGFKLCCDSLEIGIRVIMHVFLYCREYARCN